MYTAFVTTDYFKELACGPIILLLQKVFIAHTDNATWEK